MTRHVAHVLASLVAGMAVLLGGCWPRIGDLRDDPEPDAADVRLDASVDGHLDGSQATDAYGADATPDVGKSPPQFVVATISGVVDGNEITADTPVGSSPGDLVLITIYVGYGGQDATLLDALGWTIDPPVAPPSCGGFWVWYGYRLVQSGDPIQYRFVFASPEGLERSSVLQLVYRGVDGVQPFVTRQSGGRLSDDYSLPRFTIPVSNVRLAAVYADGFNAGGNWQPPGGMEEVFDNGIMGAFHAVQSDPGMSLEGVPVSSSMPGGCATYFMAALNPM